MGRPQVIRECLCGAKLSAREMREHRCTVKSKLVQGGSGGRPKELRECRCGVWLSRRELRAHKCPGPSRSLPVAGEITREEMISRISAWQTEHGHKRRYGTGSIFQAKNGTWYGFITVGRDESGNRIRKKLTGHSREEVETKLETAGCVLGIAPVTSAPRTVANRSYGQLRRMYDQIVEQVSSH
jgi:hypothetical protein